MGWTIYLVDMADLMSKSWMNTLNLSRDDRLSTGLTDKRCYGMLHTMPGCDPRGRCSNEAII